MSNYYSKKDAKVNISIELENRGWKIYGFKEDKSDSMTDYCDPANWNGIATKNGYVLVVDDKYGSNSGKDITKWTGKGALSASDNNKIEALKKMTQENGATIGEEENAKSLIEKIESKREGGNGWEVIDKYPVYMPNGKGYIWHIEKDGALVDKGNQLTIFSDLPCSWEYDINTMTYKQGYSHKSEYNYETGEYERIERTLPENQEKAIKAFKSFILRVERAVNGMNTCGDGTRETAQKAAEQQESEKMEKVIEKVTKKVVKKVEVKREFLQVGDIFFENGYGYLKVYEIDDTCYKVVKIGKESRGYQESKAQNAKSRWTKKSINRGLELGRIKVYVLQEVEEIQEVEKWVKVKINKTTQKTEEVNQESIVNEVETEPENNEEITVKLNEEKKGIEIYFTNKPEKEVIESLKNHGFRWHRTGLYWYAKQSEENLSFANSLLNNGSNETLQSEDVENKADFVMDTSITLMEKYGLNHSNYSTNENYKNDLLQSLKDNNINKSILKKVIKYISDNYNFEGLQEVLNGFLSLDKQSIDNSIIENEKLLNKINSQIESNNKKIEKLSGNYSTNTWKRMKEQENRDKQKESLQLDNSILEYLKNRIDSNNISSFEKELVTRSLREEFNGYYVRLTKHNTDNIFPFINPSWGKESAWYKEMKNRIKRLNKINITNNIQLKNIVMNDYKYIIDNLENNYNPLIVKIKKLENEYRMQQKGDINFTPKKLVNELIEIADIQQGEKVLEPSAGIGFIADELKQYTNNIDTIEYNNGFSDLLKLKGYNVVGGDFLEYTNYNTYDKIVMNPPFSDEINHIYNAYKCLKNDGKIVAITSTHWTFANDKESINFRNWLENNVNFYEVIESDIKFEKTNVNYKILVVEKSEYNSMAI